MKIKLLCFDIDGTLLIDDKPLEGAVDVINKLKEYFHIVYVTNTTSKPGYELEKILKNHNFPCPNNLYTPSFVAKKVMVENKHTRGLLLCPDTTRNEFNWFQLDENGNTVLIADEGYNITFKDLEPFLELLLKNDDSVIYTLQKNRYYKSEGKFKLDMGPIVSAIEYAANKEAIVLGKPSKTLFQTIAKDFKCNMNEIAIIGDDIEFDILIPMKFGLTGISVKTGKYIEHVYKNICKIYNYFPDYTIENVLELVKLFK